MMPRLALLATFAAGASLATAAPTLAAPACITPAAEPSGFNEPSLVATIPGAPLRWFAERWTGPHGGSLSILDCQGRRITSIGLGYARRLRPGPRLNDLPTMEVEYVTGTGTGVWTNGVALLQYRDGRLDTLWRHEATGALAASWFGVNGVDHTVRYRWRYAADGTRVVVRGTKGYGSITNMKTAALRGATRPLPGEAYCYRRSLGRFIACA